MARIEVTIIMIGIEVNNMNEITAIMATVGNTMAMNAKHDVESKACL
jgi:hypothetical protein